ncbi:MAG: class I SAM-dependent methyltransferase [Mastigocoleus sp.]
MSTKTKEIVEVYGKSKATEHYLSPSRRDGVKIAWEEPFSCMVYQKAIQKIGYKPGQSLRVIDVGCGTGDGIALLTNSLMKNSGFRLEDDIDYLGVDISQEMCDAATSLNIGRKNVRFAQGDVRQGLPNENFDLYLSCGVPYSHLTSDELQIALENIFTNIQRQNKQSVVLIDVLGRYSIEWISKWGKNRWDYRMNFFQSDGEADFTPMSFYSAEDLNHLIDQASANVNLKPKEVEFFDRSIMTGRHTSTAEFTPNLPRYRNLVNSLMSPDRTTDFEELVFKLDVDNAPEEISNFFKNFSVYWNQLVAEAAQIAGKPISRGYINLPPEFQNFTFELQYLIDKSSTRDIRASVIEPTLAKYLQRLESSAQPGLGIGHTLMALISF